MSTATSLIFRVVRLVAGGSDSAGTPWFGLAILLVSVALSASQSSAPLLSADPMRW